MYSILLGSLLTSWNSFIYSNTIQKLFIKDLNQKWEVLFICTATFGYLYVITLLFYVFVEAEMATKFPQP